MKRFVKFRVYDYMDCHSGEEVIVFSGESVAQIAEKAHNWAKGMCEEYSGGTTTMLAVMTMEEAKAYCDKLIAKVMSNPRKYSEDSIEHINKMYNECY